MFVDPESALLLQYNQPLFDVKFREISGNPSGSTLTSITTTTSCLHLDAQQWVKFLPTAREDNVFISVCHSVHNRSHAYSVTAHPCWLLGHLLQCGRYASYWNAFFFRLYFYFIIKCFFPV